MASGDEGRPGTAGVGVSRTDSQGRSTLRRAWPVLRFVLGLGGAALVAWVLSSHTDELSGLSSIFDHLRWGWLVPAVVVEGASFVSLALVQRRLLATGGVDASLRTLSVLTLASQAIINSVPGGAAVAAVYGFRWFRRLGASELAGRLVAGRPRSWSACSRWPSWRRPGSALAAS